MPMHDDIADIVREEAERSIIWRFWSCLNGCIIQLFIGLILLAILAYVAFLLVFGGELQNVREVVERPKVEETGEGEEVERRRPSNGVWSGNAPFRCGGNASMEVRGAQASLPGQVAIIAEQNCELTLVDVEVSAETAVLARGNARVNVHGDSTLQGDRFAVEAQGNSEVNAYGATIVGGVDVRGNASFDQ